MLRWIFFGSLLMFPLLFVSAQPALNPERQLTQYVLDNWTTDEGLPTNTLLHLYQTRAGYLWISSYDGLVRFDGLNFTAFNSQNTEVFKSNTFTQMSQDRQGTLWIGSYGSGLIAYRQDTFASYPFRHLIKSLFVDEQSDEIWLGTKSEGVFLFNGEDFRPALFSPLRDITVLDFERSRDGSLWVATDGSGLVQHKNGNYTQFTTDDGLGGNTVSALLADRKGRLWIGTQAGLQLRENGRFRTLPELRGFVINRILEDAAGTIWISTWDGLFRYLPNGRLERLDETNGLPHANTTDLFAGRSGSLWVGTYWAGLCRLRDGKFLNYTPQEGLGKSVPLSVCQFGKDRYLIGTDQGRVFQVRENEVSPFPLRTKIPKSVRHLFVDSKKRLWVSHYGGLVRRDPDGTETALRSGTELPDGMVRQVLETPDGTIWVASLGGLTAISSDGKRQSWTKKDGLSSEQVMCLSPGQNGTLWIGTNGEGINHLNPETGAVRVLRETDGLGGNIVLNLHTSAHGSSLWAACNGGLTHLRNDSLFTFKTRHGLVNNTPFDFLTDEQGDAWIPTNRGVMRIPLTAFDAVAAGKTDRLSPVKLFNRQDGMVRSEYSGPNQAFRDQEGRLWFPTIGGVAMLDPQQVTINRKVLPVFLTGISVDGKPYEDFTSLEVPPGGHRLAFHYTALSMRAPRKTRFRCQLIGFDEDWVEMGKARTAVYTNLPPGTHTFRVTAANSDGVWNTEPAAITFSVQPYFYQTTWFWLVAALATIFGFVGIYRWRSLRIRQRNRFLQQQVRKRTAELEDKNFQIEKKNRKITSSLQYAQRIQRAVMPSAERVDKLLPEAFVWLEPRDIVSGDFYWVAEQEGKIIFTAADCTGHGVPGAFMSVLGMELLENVVNKQGITEAGKILDALHEGVQNALKQGERRVEDGMDIALCVIDFRLGRLEFAGAKNPLVWIEDGQIRQIKGDRMAVGGFKLEKRSKRPPFQTHYVPLRSPKGEPSMFYLFSDGFQDQFGGDEGRKFMKGKLKKLFQRIHQEKPERQAALLAETFTDWKAEHHQTDDVIVVGFRGQ